MQILVIGGSGFLSSAVAAELQSAGHEVTALTRGRRPLPGGVKALVGDRQDADGFLSLLAGRPFDAVIDCICYAPAEAELDVRGFGGGRVGRLVFISTDFVYGAPRTLPIDEDTD